MAALEELFRQYPFGRPISADDWYTLPDELDRYELYEGALLLRERPDLNHQAVVARLAIPLTESARREGGFGGKMPAYFEHGVREVWLVDPSACTVAVYTSATAAPAIVAFGAEIPSTVVTVGNGGLDTLPALDSRRRFS